MYSYLVFPKLFKVTEIVYCMLTFESKYKLIQIITNKINMLYSGPQNKGKKEENAYNVVYVVSE